MKRGRIIRHNGERSSFIVMLLLNPWKLNYLTMPAAFWYYSASSATQLQTQHSAYTLKLSLNLAKMSAPSLPRRRPSVGINQSCGQPPTSKEPSKVNFPKVPEEKEVCLKFQPDPAAMELFDTDIARILLDNDLPVTVIVQETFHSPRSFLTVDKGVLLTLHLIRRPTRVYATDSNDNDYYLPACASQLYQVLPMSK